MIDRREQQGLLRAVGLALIVGMGTTACGGATSNGTAKAGCDKYRVYAQNRWAPLGAAVHAQPDILSPKIGGFAGDEVIAVNGWEHTGQPVYPHNTPPWNSDIWLHLANQKGWVDFAAVRGEPTVPDPTQQASGGQPARTPAGCELSYQP